MHCDKYWSNSYGQDIFCKYAFAIILRKHLRLLEVHNYVGKERPKVRGAWWGHTLGNVLGRCAGARQAICLLPYVNFRNKMKVKSIVGPI